MDDENRILHDLITGERIKTRDEKKKREEDEAYRRDVSQSLALAASLGFSIVVPIVAGTLIGRFVDQKFSISPSFTLLFLFIGAVIGILQIVRLMKENTK